jgi:eukaryotic-like serine/threonine-protein kinase
MPSSVSTEFLALQEAIAGRYSLDREIGRGGMGVVFLARDVMLDRLVAIKLLPPALAHSPELRARFLREARAAARLSHPHIVPVHAVEEQAELAFFVMAYVDGETLGERVRRAGPLPAAEAARVMQEVAWALGHAHAHGIAHRDVKPDNVMLERATGRAVVTDFGIARHTDAEATPGAGTPMGTPQFMSPEQACGEPGDARSDLYSLGATMYYAATGRLPFEAPTVVALLAQHATAAPRPARELRPALPERFASLLDRCLAKEPASRPVSADAIAESLRAGGARAEVAPAVRAYLRESESALRDAGTALTASAVSIGVLLTWGSADLASIFAAVAYWFIAGLAASVGALRLAQWARETRALRREGYGHDAVRSAAALVEAERAEEATVRTGAGVRPWLRFGLGAAAAAGFVWATHQNVTGFPDWIFSFGSVLAPTLTVRALWDDLRRGPPLWSRVVRGRVGRSVFRAASLGLPAPSRVAVEGQPTALVLEHALEELYAALPPAERARFAEVPAVVERLRADALADDDARRAHAVAALESLRLDLLRVHAGQGAGGLTQHIEDARRIGERVDEVVPSALTARSAGTQSRELGS